MSVANAWASAHALSMVMWSNPQIVVGYYLNMLTLLFKPMMLRVWIMNFQMISLIFGHSALHMLLGICLSYTFLIQVDVF